MLLPQRRLPRPNVQLRTIYISIILSGLTPALLASCHENKKVGEISASATETSGSGTSSANSDATSTSESGSTSATGSASNSDSDAGSASESDSGSGTSTGGFICGDGTVDPGESCDDGNGIPADGCEENCTVTRVSFLEAGWKHTCALFEHGEVRCWGQNQYGQLGLAHTSNIGDDELPADSPPIRLGGPVVQLAVGDLHNCAIFANGDVRCWGEGREGKLGYGNVNNIGDDEHPEDLPPVPLGAKAIQIQAGSRSSCALLDDNTVRCWGFAGHGALGGASSANIGDDEPASSGPLVSLGGPVKAIYSGGHNTCAHMQSGDLMCWGANDYGQTGHGSTQDLGDDETPVSWGPVDVGGPIQAIFKAEQHTCVLLPGDTMRCWGAGNEGRLGYGNTDAIGDDELPSSAPLVDVGGPVLTANGGAHSCVVTTDSVVRCWGWNDSGQLGLGHTQTMSGIPANIAPVDVGGDGRVVLLAPGNYHSCILTDAAEVRCWGRGLDGRLGHGNTDDIGDDELPSSIGNVVVY